ncbi:MAG: copper chaperone PCu(A)C [Balneolaceae bacterium]|nr:copper chaperone PCu(A)C [Balneolaceae bacterium]
MNFSKLILLTLTALLIFVGCQSESRQDRAKNTDKISTSDSIEISNAWTRPGGKGRNSAVYMRIYNGTGQPDSLIAVETEIAQKAEAHESYEEDGMMGMRPVGVLPIKPDSVLKLQPGGVHIMLMNLNQSIADGDSILVQLLFSQSGSINVTIPVQLTNS